MQLSTFFAVQKSQKKKKNILALGWVNMCTICCFACFNLEKVDLICFGQRGMLWNTVFGAGATRKREALWRSRLMGLRCQRAQLTANMAHFPQYFCNMFHPCFRLQMSFSLSLLVIVRFFHSISKKCLYYCQARIEWPSIHRPGNTLFKLENSTTLTLHTMNEWL